MPDPVDPPDDAAIREELLKSTAVLEQRLHQRTEELRKAHLQLRQNMLTTVKAFIALLGLRHPSLASHSKRVAYTARLMANHLVMGADEVQQVFFAGLLHDVGKISFPDNMLGTPVRTFNNEQMARYRMHPVDTENALLLLEEMAPVAQLVRHHHENFDGKGFPDGLQGDAIPYGARLLAVADGYDAFQQGTVVSSHLTQYAALDAMEKARGQRYDPQMLDVLLEVLAAQRQTRQCERELHVSELEPGMTLNRDLVRKDGMPLLAAGQVLAQGLIERLHAYQRTLGEDLLVYVRGA